MVKISKKKHNKSDNEKEKHNNGWKKRLLWSSWSF
jgi:hypothetical protein